MSRLTGWLYTLRSLLRRNEADREMADEIAFHIERQTRKHETLGLSGKQAHERALLEFGGATRWREEARRARASTTVDLIERDVRQALRGLRRDPAFATMAIVTLALAIAANATMFGIVDRVLLRGPEHLVAPDQVVRVYVTRGTPNAAASPSALQPYALYLGARDHTSAFATVATYLPLDARVGSGIESRLVRVTYATPDFFSLAQVGPVVNILRLRVPGVDSLSGKAGFALVTGAASRYFETVGTRILRGRGFGESEGFGPEPVVIVNETMARTLWPGLDAIGRCVVLRGAPDGPCARVVGIARDVHQMTLKEEALSQAYVPWGQDQRFIQGSVLLVRGRGDVSGLAAALTDIVRHARPAVRSLEIKTFEELLDPQVRPWRVGATLFGLFGAIVVAVAAIGLFSVVSYLVTQRTHELGVRIALGARREQVLRLILGGALRTAIVGAVVGGALSVAIGPVIEPLLFDNRARDPLLLSLVATALLVVAIAASLWPAWRASRVDPLLALRAD